MYLIGQVHADDVYSKTLPEDAVVVEGTKSYIFVREEEHHQEEATEAHDHREVEVEHADEQHDAEMPGDDAFAFRVVEVITGRILQIACIAMMAPVHLN